MHTNMQQAIRSVNCDSRNNVTHQCIGHAFDWCHTTLTAIATQYSLSHIRVAFLGCVSIYLKIQCCNYNTTYSHTQRILWGILSTFGITCFSYITKYQNIKYKYLIRKKFLRKYWGSPIWKSAQIQFIVNTQMSMERDRYSSKLITLRRYQYIGDIHDAHRVLSLFIKYGGMNLQLPILRSVFAPYGSFNIELKMKSVVVIVLIALFCSVCSAAPSSEGRNHSFFLIVWLT